MFFTICVVYRRQVVIYVDCSEQGCSLGFEKEKKRKEKKRKFECFGHLFFWLTWDPGNFGFIKNTFSLQLTLFLWGLHTHTHTADVLISLSVKGYPWHSQTIAWSIPKPFPHHSQWSSSLLQGRNEVNLSQPKFCHVCSDWQAVKGAQTKLLRKDTRLTVRRMIWFEHHVQFTSIFLCRLQVFVKEKKKQ